MLESDVHLRSAVENALSHRLVRVAESDAAKITVDARRGHIELKGTVRSYAERQDAERAAWATPGVTSVDDQLAIEVAAHLTDE